MSRGLAVAAAVAITLAAAGAGLAGDPSKERIARTAAGDAQAKREVVRRADMGPGWTGGFSKPHLSSSMPCTSYRPKQSDLVVVGAAETIFTKAPLQLDSEAQVLRTAAMVQRDWQRTIVDPRVLPCLREGFRKALGANFKLASFRQVAFPRLAPRTRAFRMVATVKTEVGSGAIEIDFLAMGSGRNELTLTISGPTSARDGLHAMEVRLGRAMAHRTRR
jgi:hypothetical protein